MLSIIFALLWVFLKLLRQLSSILLVKLWQLRLPTPTLNNSCWGRILSTWSQCRKEQYILSIFQHLWPPWRQQPFISIPKLEIGSTSWPAWAWNLFLLACLLCTMALMNPTQLLSPLETLSNMPLLWVLSCRLCRWKMLIYLNYC